MIAKAACRVGEFCGKDWERVDDGGGEKPCDDVWLLKMLSINCLWRWQIFGRSRFSAAFYCTA